MPANRSPRGSAAGDAGVTTATESVAVSGAKRSRNLLPNRTSEAWRRRLPLLPALLFTIVLTQVPFVMSIWYSLTDWKVVPPGPSEFVGLDNYVELVKDNFFRDAVWVSVQLTVFPVLGAIALGTAFAVLLDRKFLGQGVVRTLIITPFLLMPVVVGLVWKNQMFNGLYGVINWVIEQLGFASVEWVSRYPTLSIAIVLIWQWTPFMMLIMLAGLQSQPADVLEAAKVDGTSAWGTFRQLTIPHLRPYMELGVLLGTIYLIQVYDQVAVMTGGGPGSTNVPYFVFERSIGGGWEFGQASSYSIVVVIASIIIATIALRVLSNLLKGEEAA
jgi:polyol transport system permease protein